MPQSPRTLLLPLFLAALAYPFLLFQFKASVSPGSVAGLSALWLGLAFLVPVVGFGFAMSLSGVNRDRGLGARSVRRFAYLVVAAPTLFTFMGVITYMGKSPIADLWVWAAIWLLLLAAAWLASIGVGGRTVRAVSGWRVAHGISGAVLAVFVLFHLGNHLTGLIGAEAHKATMDAGRKVYRSIFVEPVLVTAFFFQIITGLRLAWRWSAEKADGFRVFQVASGFYLSLYILGHMNSVFVFARTYLKSDTGWGFATGAPTGLIHDPWNIRLVPHYWFGVFLVLGHFAAGLRVVLLAHGVPQKTANGIFFASVAASFAIATAILLGMCGVRI